MALQAKWCLLRPSVPSYPSGGPEVREAGDASAWARVLSPGSQSLAGKAYTRLQKRRKESLSWNQDAR